MNRALFRYVGWRHLRLKPARSVLTTVGVALGISLFIAIGIINRSTLASFEESIEAVAGKTTLVVSAGEMGFPEEKLEIVARVPGVTHAVPMIESRAYFTGGTGDGASETLIILGVDLLREQAVRTYRTSDEQLIDDPLVFLNQPDSIIVTHAWAQAHGLKIDSTFELATARGKRKFTVRGLLSPEGPAKAYGGAVAIMDVDGARLTFGKENKLDRIDVVTKKGGDAPEVVGDRIRAALGPGYIVEKPETQNENMQKMVSTYQVMLTFFSTLALLVGLFLVTNSVTIAVAERKREIGTLRALGATRGGILALFLTEAAVLGGIGGFAGTWLGRALASVLVGLVTRSMSSQYLMRIDVTSLKFGGGEVLRGAAIGAGASLVAAFWPAFKTTRIQPLEAMKNRESGEGSDRGFFRYAPYLGLAAFAWVTLSTLLGLPARFLGFDTINQLFSMGGSALLGPSLVILMIRLVRPWVLRLGTVPRLAQDNLLRNPRRTGSNVVSLMVGLILVIMIASVNMSFSRTLSTWFNKIMRADLLISSAGRVISYQVQPLHEDLGRELLEVPGVRSEAGRSAYALRFVHVRYAGRTIGLKAYDEPEASLNYSTLDVRDRPAAEAGYELYHSSDPTVLVSENFALHFKKTTGEFVDLESPSGLVRARIVGILVDFASPEGVIYMARDRYKTLWHDPLVSAFGVQLAPGFTEDQVRGEIDRRFGKSKNLMVVSNAEIKRQMIDVIDQSFTYTRAIEAAALLVGLLGLLNTLLVSVMERMRELGMLRAVGMSRGQMSRMILQEAVMQGFFGAIAAVGLGSFVAYLWITHSLAHVFGWMIHFYFPWTSVLTTLALGTSVAMIAGFLPARRASHLEIREALEYE